ncbi:MAG: methyltransferase type 11 [Candidatus Omnitrophica bacterium CG1_02_49_16]|nr:MAG: methyltransferase type 11 [Candidatus Omnitrophica bacterium CG1_02_49_16]
MTEPLRKENRVREQYDDLAVKYDSRWQGYISSTLGYLHKWLDLKGTEKVLDVACGTGALEQLLVRSHPGQSISGIDISEKMLSIARHKLSAYPRVAFFKASASAISFPKETFDVVVCANAFHYFENPLACLIEMKRVLKRGGRIVILDWCRDYLICRLCDLFLKAFDPAYRRCYTQRELNTFLIEAKLRILRAQKFGTSSIWGMMVADAGIEEFSGRQP